MTKNHYTHIKSIFAPQEGGNMYSKRRWRGVSKHVKVVAMEIVWSVSKGRIWEQQRVLYRSWQEVGWVRATGEI